MGLFGAAGHKINDRFLRFLNKALYQDSSCRVRVDDKLGEELMLALD